MKSIALKVIINEVLKTININNLNFDFGTAERL